MSEDMTEGARNHARVLIGDAVEDTHRVRLARARLPVRKDGAIVTAEHILHHRATDRVVDLILQCLGTEHIVEIEIARLRAAHCCGGSIAAANALGELHLGAQHAVLPRRIA